MCVNIDRCDVDEDHSNVVMLDIRWSFSKNDWLLDDEVDTKTMESNRERQQRMNNYILE
jgi:hypothetical protein